MSEEEFLELMGKGSENENKKLIDAIEKVFAEKEKEPIDDPEEGWHSDLEEEFIKMYAKDPDAAWLGLMGAIMSSNFPEEMLRHYGIDGQKWGVRNGPPYPLERGRHRKATVVDKANRILVDVDDLSLEELRVLVTKLELQKKLIDLTAPQKKQGKSYAMKVLSKVGDTALSVAVPAATSYAIKKMVENVAGEDVVAEMFPKKK